MLAGLMLVLEVLKTDGTRRKVQVIFRSKDNQFAFKIEKSLPPDALPMERAEKTIRAIRLYPLPKNAEDHLKAPREIPLGRDEEIESVDVSIHEADATVADVAEVIEI